MLNWLAQRGVLGTSLLRTDGPRRRLKVSLPSSSEPMSRS